MTPKFLLVDDHPVFRRGLRQVLAEEFPKAQFGEASNGQEALQLASRSAWDLVILDVVLPGPSGLDIMPELRQHLTKTPVLVLSYRSELVYGIRALKLGAAGYLPKHTAPEVVLDAVKQVLAGRRYVTSALAELLAGGLGADAKPPHESLSNREFEILRRLGSGMGLTEIAQELSLSPKTIATYRARLLEKMRLKSNAQLIRYVIDYGLVD